MNDDTVIGIDIGGTTAKVIVGHRRFTVPTGFGRQPAELLDAIVTAIEDCLELPNGGLARGDCRALGVAVPGIVDDMSGTATFSANLGWRNVPIGELVRSRTGLNVVISHDVAAAAYAESRVGAAIGVDDFVYLSIGTGLAASVFVHGRRLRGAHGHAGEIGHLRKSFDEPCPCGSRGCVERRVSASGLERSFAAASGREGVTAEQVIASVREGHSQATAVWSVFLDDLAEVLIDLALTFDPAVIVVGGGLAASGELLLTPARATLERRVAQLGLTPSTLTQSTVGRFAGALGAAMLATIPTDLS